MNRKITIFKSVTDVDTPFFPDLETVLERILTGSKSKDIVTQIRKEKDKEKRNLIKKKLAAICFSGEFSSRSSSGLTQHSGLICLDFDKFKNVPAMKKAKETLRQDKYVMAVFVSPSGDGLKVLVKIPPVVEDHKLHFNSLGDYFGMDEFDIACKDVGRVCYESYDPDIYINPESEEYTEKLEERVREIEKKENIKTILVHDENIIIEKLMVWWNRECGFVDGERNTNLHKLACALSNYGITESVALNHIRYICSSDTKNAPESELASLVKSAYKLATFGNKVFEDKEKISEIEQKLKHGVSKGDVKDELIEAGIEESIAKAVIEKAEDTAHITVSKFWRKSDKGVVYLLHHKYRDFLIDNGFFKYYPEGSVNFIFVKRESNRVSNVNDDIIKSFTLKYIEKNISDPSIWDFFAENTKYFKEGFLSFLPEVGINFIEDTPEESYMFYSNVAVRVTRDEITPIEYEDMKGWVWQDQVLDREYNECEESGCDFKKFVSNVSGGDKDRIQSVESSIGFLLHTYKDKSRCPAIILNDEVISSNPEGGTGKSMWAHAISYLRKTVTIDGRKFNPQKSFPYQRVQQDTQVLIFDDIRPDFPLEFIFNVITGGIELEKKNRDEIEIPFERSPKVIITTNFAMKGSGNSHERRKWELEFKQHYKKGYTPLEEFGRRLFDDWDESEWKLYDKYMLGCLKGYLRTGLVESAFVNLLERKFISETSYDFYEWITQPGLTYSVAGVRHRASEAYYKFVEENPDYARSTGGKLNHSTFNRWMILFGTYKYGTATKEGRSSDGKWIEFTPTPKDVQGKLKI